LYQRAPIHGFVPGEIHFLQRSIEENFGDR
jgi:hypothetical protein